MQRVRYGVFLATIVSLATTTACTGDENTGKGAESDMPVEGGADSWYYPTHHGELAFGLSNPGEFTADSMYHTWTFSLSENADVTLTVEPGAANFDTVLYLYQRESGATNWGSYIARNDDYDGKLWSRISKNLDGGEYKIMLKGYKESLRGSFDLAAECEGDGCPLNTQCEDGVFAAMPATTEFTTECVARMHRAIYGPYSTQTGYNLTEEQRCSRGSVVQNGWEYYYEYWESLVGWADLVYDPQEALSFDVDVTVYGENGTMVDVDYGGDEMAMTLLFDDQGEAILYYQHNQSPDLGFFCNDDPDHYALELQDPACLAAYLNTMTRTGDPTERDGDSVPIEDLESSDLPAAAINAVYKYQELFGVSNFDTAHVDYMHWQGSHQELFIVDIYVEPYADTRYFYGGDSWTLYHFGREVRDEPFYFLCHEVQ